MPIIEKTRTSVNCAPPVRKGALLRMGCVPNEVVRDMNLDYRLVWEANNGDTSGWYTVGIGEEYRFFLDKDNVERDYRVVVFAVK